jgi:hypothetical protein
MLGKNKAPSWEAKLKEDSFLATEDISPESERQLEATMGEKHHSLRMRHTEAKTVCLKEYLKLRTEPDHDPERYIIMGLHIDADVPSTFIGPIWAVYIEDVLLAVPNTSATTTH